MAGVTWFKVLTDIFADDKIKIIQSMPEGDSILVTWFKVLSQAGKTNDGGYIYLRKNIPYTNTMLATLFNKPQMIVDLAIKTFIQFEMIDIDDNGYIFVTNWEKHQSIDALEKIKEQDRIRSANYRERKRLELKESHVTITLPSQTNHAIDLELDLELEKEKIKDIVVKHDIPYSEIIDYLNEKAGTKYKSNTKSTKEHINARHKEGFTIDDFKLVIDKKCAEWIGTTYEQYLRPNTLFIAGKFESYVNQSYTSSSTSVVGRTGQAAYRTEPPLKTLAQHKAEEQELIEKRRAERAGMI